MSASFASQIRGFSARTRERFDLAMQKIHMDFTAELVQMTPVDTGLAQSNWFPAVVRSEARESSAVRGGGPSLRRSAEFSSTLRAGGVYYITNNLPYIMRLEYGWSGQAPSGMARRAVERWQPIVERVARQVSR